MFAADIHDIVLLRCRIRISYVSSLFKIGPIHVVTRPAGLQSVVEWWGTPPTYRSVSLVQDLDHDLPF